MFTLVATQRKRREIDPILNTLRRCRAELSPENLGGHAEEPAAEERRHRINDLLSYLTLVDSLAQRLFESHHGLRDAVDLRATLSGKDQSASLSLGAIDSRLLCLALVTPVDER